MPTFFLSGALFPLDGLPSVLTVITRINPLSYGVDGLRATLIGQSHFGLGLDFTVLILVTVFAIILGAYSFSKIEA